MSAWKNFYVEYNQTNGITFNADGSISISEDASEAQKEQFTKIAALSNEKPAFEGDIIQEIIIS